MWQEKLLIGESISQNFQPEVHRSEFFEPVSAEHLNQIGQDLLDPLTYFPSETYSSIFLRPLAYSLDTSILKALV